MFLRLLTRIGLLGLVLAVLSALACNQLTMPRLGFEEEPTPHVPLSINLAFDEELRRATIQAEACGMPWEGRLGQTVMDQFVHVTEHSLRHVSVVGPAGSESQAASTASDPNAFTVQTSLVHHAFSDSTGFGAEDQYSVWLTIELLAIVSDAQGTPLGKVPLAYKERVNIWTPQLGGSGSSCATGQLDGALDTASKDLAKQLVMALAAWSGPPQPQLAASPAIGVTQP
ncbi:MAG: hypothetical protein ACREI3_08295, partial [Nitrospirales bacterium]